MTARQFAADETEQSGPRGFDDFELRLGDIMRGERATLGKSLLDVQRELKIKAAYIAAIENADPAAFETPGFVAGYVRSYARYLGMDPDWAYRTFCDEANFSATHGMTGTPRRPRSEPRAGRADLPRRPLHQRAHSVPAQEPAHLRRHRAGRARLDRRAAGADRRHRLRRRRRLPRGAEGPAGAGRADARGPGRRGSAVIGLPGHRRSAGRPLQAGRGRGAGPALSPQGARRAGADGARRPHRRRSTRAPSARWHRGRTPAAWRPPNLPATRPTARPRRCRPPSTRR